MYLIYSGKYNNNCNDAVNGKLSFGDDAVNGNVIFKYHNIQCVLTLGLTVTWNMRLTNYSKKQKVGIKCILYEKYPKIKTQSILFEGTLNPNANKHIWSPKQIPLKQLYPYICWKVRLGIPATTDFEYIPTIKEIEQEISKLPQEQIQKERKEYNEYLQHCDPWLVCESLEHKIQHYLIEKKKANVLKSKKLTLIKKFTNDIKNDLSDF